MDLNKFNKYLEEKEDKKIDESNFKKEREMQKKIYAISEMAQDAFWKVVMKELDMNENQEIDPYVLENFCASSTNAIKNLINKMNMSMPNVTAY